MIVSGKRNKTRAGERVNKYTARAKTIGRLCQRHKPARAIVNPSSKAQDYGVSALGATPQEVKRHARNTAIATGIGLRVGSCVTLATEWTLGHKSQPATRYAQSYIKAWARYWCQHHDERGGGGIQEA